METTLLCWEIISLGDHLNNLIFVNLYSFNTARPIILFCYPSLKKLTDANNQDYIEVKNTWGENNYPYFEVNLDGTSRLNGDINVKLLRDQFGRFGHCYYVDLN